MWPFTKKAPAYDPTAPEIRAEVRKLNAAPDKGAQLNACANDVERRSLCLQWAGEARDAYYRGRRESIVDMLLSNDLRYRHMDAATRTKIGERKWSTSLVAKEVIGLEQMYARWAVQYAGGPGAK